MGSLWLGRGPLRPSREVLTARIFGKLGWTWKDYIYCTWLSIYQHYQDIPTIPSKGDAMCFVIVDSCDLWANLWVQSSPRKKVTETAQPLQLRSRSSTSIPFCRSSFLNLSAWLQVASWLHETKMAAVWERNRVAEAFGKKGKKMGVFWLASPTVIIWWKPAEHCKTKGLQGIPMYCICRTQTNMAFEWTSLNFEGGSGASWMGQISLTRNGGTG